MTPHRVYTETLSMKPLPLAILCLLLNACAGNIDSTAREATQFTLYSLDPSRSPDEKKPASERFHGWPVLGKLEVTDPADRKKLLDALDAGIKASDGTVAACFNPRHGIRAVKGGDTIEYVICFECLQVEIHKNGKRESKLTTDDPAEVFNDYLVKAGLLRAE
jgi:hypothetical protein